MCVGFSPPPYYNQKPKETVTLKLNKFEKSVGKKCEKGIKMDIGNGKRKLEGGDDVREYIQLCRCCLIAHF